MGTVVAIETTGGAAIAGDRLTTRGRTVTSASARRVFDFEAIGAGAVGEVGVVDAFRRRLDAELRREQLERNRELDVEVLGRIAAEIAADVGVDAIVAAYDEEGVARVRQVGPDGSVLSGPVVALGTGAPIALGRLETADRDLDLRATEDVVQETIETVAARDTDTGEGVDTWSLASH